MQSTRFIEICRTISAEGQFPCLISTLELLLTNRGPWEGNRDLFNEQIFRAREGIFVLAKDSDVDAVMEALQIRNAFEPRVVTKLITIFQQHVHAGSLLENATQMRIVQDFFYKIRAFDNYLNGLSTLVDSPRRKIEKNQAIIEIELLSLGTQGFQFVRVESVLPLIRGLYEQVARIYDANPEGATLAFFDSGSPLVIAVKGDANLIKAIESLFSAVWNKIRFRKIEDLNRKLDTIDSSLDILVKIREKEKSGAINAEDAARFSTLISDQVTGMLKLGAAPKSIRRDETLKNSALLRDKVESKFLQAPPEQQAGVIQQQNC